MIFILAATQHASQLKMPKYFFLRNLVFKFGFCMKIDEKH